MEKFARDVLVKRGTERNIPAKNYVAYCTFTDEQMAVEIPEGIQHSSVVIDDDGNTRQKTLAEYLMVESVAGTYRLAPMHFNRGRYSILAKDSLELWDQLLTPYGLPSSTWLTVDEYKATLPVEEL